MNQHTVINPDLQFMKNIEVVYYAGLDPIGPHVLKGRSNYNINQQVVFLKALGLVLDHIVVPPTFFFPAFPFDGQPAPFIKDLIELYQCNILSSPVHSGMTSSYDFLIVKEGHGSRFDRKYIKNRKKNLSLLFKNMPLLHRDVHVQSNRFNYLLEQQVVKFRNIDWLQRIFESAYAMEEMEQIKISRDSILELAKQQLINQNISKSQFDKLYQMTMSMYYAAGAETYYADISTVNSEIFNSLGVDRFSSNSQRILVGYEPVVLLNIFKAHGISETMIKSLSIHDISLFRSTDVFRRFVKKYKEFSEQLQSCLSTYKKPTQSLLQQLKTDILIKFCQQRNRAFEIRKSYSFWHEARLGFYIGIFSGVAGFMVSPLIGAILALIPPALYAIKAQDKLINYMVDRIASSETVFDDYIQDLKYLTNRLAEIE